MKKAFIYLLSLTILALGTSALLRLVFGVRPIGLILAAGFLIAWLLPAGLILAARRLKPRVWLFLGLLALAGLLLPTSLLVDFDLNLGARLPQRFASPVFLLLLCMPSAALVTAALLLFTGVRAIISGRDNGLQVDHTGEKETSGRGAGRRGLAVAAFSLCALLLGLIHYNLYWLVAWDMTSDSLESLWLLPPAFAALLSGIILLAALRGKAKLASLYFPFVLVLMAAIFAAARQTGFQARTEARAEQISRALASYHAREGRYPENLRALVPRDTLRIPAPFIISGQDWCYDSGDNYYRLGYVSRDHWSSPNFSGQLSSASGQPADLPPICEGEINALRKRFTGIYSQGSR